MAPSHTTSRARAPYPSSLPSTPSQTKCSEGSSPVYTTTSRPLPSPPFSAITRPTMRTKRYSWDDRSGDNATPQGQSGTAVENILSQPQPLSYPYDTLMSDVRSMGQSPINMPDHNEYVRPIFAGSRRNQDFLRSPPYPIHDDDIQGPSAGAIYGNKSRILRRPTTEDFLRSDHPLPAPLPGYDSDQDLPVIEPDSYLSENIHNEQEPQLVHTQYQKSSVAVPERKSATANALEHPGPATRPNYKRSKSESTPPSHVPALAYEPTISEHHSTPERVPAIGVDMYQPALGGLQMVSVIQRSDPKRDRVRRWMRGHNPFHRERKLGRQQSD